MSTQFYQLIRRFEPHARKPYQCIWCGEGIVMGEKHVHEASSYDYRLQDHRWHPECEKAAHQYFATGEECFDAYENRRPKCETMKQYIANEIERVK